MQTSAKSKLAAKAKLPTAREQDAVQERFDAVFGGPVTVPRSGIAFRQLLFHGKSSEHLWCRVCTRAFPNGTYRQVGEMRRCPYADCNGHATVDALEWARVQITNADYPQAPILGKAYPMGPVAPLRRAVVP